MNRGGSWFNHPFLERSAIRSSLAPRDRGPLLGFRVARIEPGR
jgi:formylglycine-generating enzyme required for sulfatase activity